MLDENSPFNNKIKTEDIEDKLFDDSDSKVIRKVSDGVIEEINFGSNIEIPSDEVTVDGPKQIKVIPNPNSIRLASNRITRKISKARAKRKSEKKKHKKSAEWLKKTGFLGLDGFQTIDYNNDATLDNLET